MGNIEISFLELTALKRYTKAQVPQKRASGVHLAAILKEGHEEE
jgi:hypothetical protein